MRQHFAGLVAFLLSWACVTPPLFSQDTDSWVGKQVMVVRWDVELKAGSDVVGRARLGRVFQVLRVNGPWLWIERARGWIKRSDVVLYDRAIEHFTAAIQRNPSAEAHHQRGVALVALGQYEKAVADFDAAIERKSKNVAIFNDRGNALRKIGKPDRAIEDFNRVIGSGIRHPAVYTNRGLAWYDKGDYGRALADYNAAIRLDVKFAPAWEAGGTARQAQRDYARAIANFSRAVELDPKFDRSHNNLAWLLATCPLEDLRDGKQAVEYATKACELTQFQDADYLDTLAAAYAEAGQFAEAIMRAKEAIALAADSDKAKITGRLRAYEAGRPFHESSD